MNLPNPGFPPGLRVCRTDPKSWRNLRTTAHTWQHGLWSEPTGFTVTQLQSKPPKNINTVQMILAGPTKLSHDEILKMSRTRPIITQHIKGQEKTTDRGQPEDPDVKLIEGREASSRTHPNKAASPEALPSGLRYPPPNILHQESPAVWSCHHSCPARDTFSFPSPETWGGLPQQALGLEALCPTGRGSYSTQRHQAARPQEAPSAS